PGTAATSSCCSCPTSPREARSRTWPSACWRRSAPPSPSPARWWPSARPSASRPTPTTGVRPSGSSTRRTTRCTSARPTARAASSSSGARRRPAEVSALASRGRPGRSGSASRVGPGVAAACREPAAVRAPRSPSRGRNALRPRPVGSIVDPEVRRPLAPAGAPALVGRVATPETGMPADGRSHPSLPNVTTRGEGGDVVADVERTGGGSHVAARPAVGRGRGGAEGPVRRVAMARCEDGPRQWAYLLIVGGLVLLAMQLGWLGWLSDWLWAAVFLAGGAAFAYQYRVDPQRWWALIPGAALAAIGVTFLTGAVGGAYFLG